MENYIGLFVGVENYQNSDALKKVAFAEDDASGVREAFLHLGCYEDRLELLLSGTATLATVKSKVKHLSRRATKDDVVVFYFAGHGIRTGLGNRITCSDTSKEDIDGTTIGLNDILSEFQKSTCSRIIMFLDCCHSGIQFDPVDRAPTWTVSYEDLIYEAQGVDHLAVFSASKNDETSLADFDRKHGIWSYFLIQALTGNAHKIYEDRLLFSDRLQKYLREETVVRSSLISMPKRTQTPQFGGSITDRFIVADLSVLFDKRARAGSSSPLPVRQSILLRWEEDPIRKLPGFNVKNHFAPTDISARSEKWIKQLAEPVILKELEKVQLDVRKKLGFARKQMPTPISIIDGVGTLATTHFDYSVSVLQSKEKPDHYVLTHTISNFRDLETITSPDFNELFGRVEELRITLPAPVDIKEVIDQIEDLNLDGLRVEYDNNDPTYCTIHIKGIDDTIRLTETTMSVVAFLRKQPRDLISSFGAGMGQLSASGGLKLLG